MTNRNRAPSTLCLALAVALYSLEVSAQGATADDALGQEVEAEALALPPVEREAASGADAQPATPITAPAPIEDRFKTAPVELPKHQRYRGEAELDGYVLEERWRPALVIPGLVLVGATYFSGLGVGSIDDFDNKKGFLAVPVIGPWLTLLSREDDCDDEDICPARRLLIASGVMQTVGLGLVIVGTTWSKRLWVREDVAVSLAPHQFAYGGYGAALSGTF